MAFAVLYYRCQTRVTRISPPPQSPAILRCCWTGSRLAWELRRPRCQRDSEATAPSVRPAERGANSSSHARPPSEVAQRLPFSVSNAAAASDSLAFLARLPGSGPTSRRCALLFPHSVSPHTTGELARPYMKNSTSCSAHERCQVFLEWLAALL